MRSQHLWILLDLGRGQMIGDDSLEEVEPEEGELRQHASLLGNPCGQHVIEGRDAVCGDKEQLVIAGLEDIAHLAAGMEFEFWDRGLQQNGAIVRSRHFTVFSLGVYGF